MVAFNPDSLCKEAETHYFDFLAEGEPDIVPRHIIDHVLGCRHCRSRIEQLGSILAHSGLNPTISQANAAIGTMLKLHFAYLGQPVTCKMVRPFLSTLIDPTLEIRIPTPIVVHLDHCQSCSKDLERIRELNLTRGQLCRLSQMYADSPKDKYIACPKAQAAINSVVNLSLHETNADILKHLCLCSFCRELVSEARKFTIRLLPESNGGDKDLLCSQISPGDIFDYAVPYGLDPASDQYAKFRESLTSHIRKCPTCLGKMQDLHQTIFGILDRPESGVATTYEVDASATEAHTNLYAGFPIKVEATGVLSTAGPVAPDRPVARRRVWTRHLKPFAAVSAVAAALIVTVIVLLSSPVAKAVTIDQIYRALELAKNVYVASFLPGISKPTQEKWVSRELGLYMTKTDTQSALWDISKGIRRSRRLEAATTEIEHLETDDAGSIEEKIAGPLGLTPFGHLSDIPSGAKWSEVTDSNLEAAEGTKIYDLEWGERTYGSNEVLKRWRVFIQVQTKLPSKVEWYQKTAFDEDFTLMQVTSVDYPSTTDIQDTVERVCP
jgi:hypothetical protein